MTVSWLVRCDTVDVSYLIRKVTQFITTGSLKIEVTKKVYDNHF